MTAKQIAKLAYPTEKTILIRGTKYPSTYQAANNMLRRMAERKEVKVHDMRKFSIPDMFMLPDTPRLKNSDKFLHEEAAADLFTTYHSHFKGWQYEPIVGSLRADRGMQLGDLTIYFEVDRLTEQVQVLRDKIDNYIRHSSETHQRFHVVFSFVGSDENVNKRGKKIIPYLEEVRRGDQFLLANHNALLLDPFGEVLYSPRGAIVSFSML